jgi:hypothetical protein
MINSNWIRNRHPEKSLWSHRGKMIRIRRSYKNAKGKMQNPSFFKMSTTKLQIKN